MYFIGIDVDSIMKAFMYWSAPPYKYSIAVPRTQTLLKRGGGNLGLDLARALWPFSGI
jgi:hypothetical protein